MDCLYFLTNEYPLTLTAISVTIGYCIYYFKWVVKRPLLVCRDGQWKEFLLDNMPILQEDYWPTPWCIDGRLQSVFGSVVRCRLTDINYERQVFELKDGGIMSLDWVSRPKRKNQPILVVLPGLTGTSQSGYIKGIVYSLRDVDASCVALNYRGMADTELKTSRTFCKANSEDFGEVLEHIHALYPDAPLVGAGISLGGMWITNYLATHGEKAHLVAGIVVSIPWNLFVATESLETPGWNMVLNYAITRSLCRIYDQRRRFLDGKDHPWQYDTIMQCKTIRQFDNNFTALNFGFKDVDDYYGRASLHDKVEKVKVPLLCLTAEDDFFQPLKGVPVARTQKSSHVALIVTSRGGHAGFMEGFVPCKTYYSDRVFGQFIRGVLNNLDQIRRIKTD